MKELKMFPQITEETEENLLNLEEEPKDSYSSTPPLNPSSSSSESPTDAPSSPNHENQVPCQLPIITTEEVDPANTSCNNHTSVLEEEFATPPPRVRMRSLSGGAYRLAPVPTTGRMRRQSGDDVLTRVSPSRRAALFEHFRPRSKSDSKGKRPTFLTSLKNSIFPGGGTQRKPSLETSEPPPLEPLQPGGDYRQRARSGSDSKGGTMSKMIDLFRSRSNSLSIDSRTKKQFSSIVPPNALLRRHSVDPDKRRKPFNSYRSLETHQGESFSCHAEDDTTESRIDYGTLEDDKIIPTFLSAHSCYDAMPKSGKVILLSTDLLVKNAFSCLVTNEIRAAPLWDSASQSFVGMLTITDFINVLRHYYYSSPGDIQQIENQKILTWRNITKVTKPFVKIGPTESLSQATKLLIQEGVHRLPVYEEKRHSVLFVITKKRLLQYLYNNLIEKFDKSNVKTPNFLKKTIGELKLGSWENIVKVTFKTRVIEALDLFIEKNVSALPVVDDDDKLIDLFAKFDVFALAKEKTYHNLDMTISETIDKAEVHEGVYVCSVDETLETVIDKFVTVKVHRLVVTDGKRTVLGIISLSDVLKFLVLQYAGETSLLAADIIEEGPEGAIGGIESDSVFLGSQMDASSSLKQSTSLEREESSDLSDDLVKLQVESQTASEVALESLEDENEQSDA